MPRAFAQACEVATGQALRTALAQRGVKNECTALLGALYVRTPPLWRRSCALSTQCGQLKPVPGLFQCCDG